MRDRLAAAIRRFSISLMLIILCVMAYFFALKDPGGVRACFTPFSRVLSAALSKTFSVFPFSAAEFLLYILLAGAAAYLMYTLAALIFRPMRTMRLLGFFSRTILYASVLLFLFTFLWGLNYMAPPLSETLGLDVFPRARQDLFDTAEALLNKANRYAALVRRGENNAADLGDFSALSKKAGEGYAALAARYPFYKCPAGLLNAPKAVAAWPLMSYMGISGIYMPYTGEANVNPSTPQACLPFTLAHEMAHRLGVAPEDEANFSAFLACIESPDDAYVYSGYYVGFLYCYDAVALLDAGEQEKLWNSLNPYVLADVRDMIEYNLRYAGPVEEAGTKINDVYLKAMMQEEGVQSYGSVTDLIITWYMNR